MAEEIAFENGRISHFEGLVTLTYCIPVCTTHLPLPTRQILIEIKETFCERMDVRTRAVPNIRFEFEPDRIVGQMYYSYSAEYCHDFEPEYK